MSEELNRQDAIDEAAAHDFMERSVMCAEVTLGGATARAIARYISNLEVESDNDLADVQALAKELMATSEDLVIQNADLKTRHADAVRLLRELKDILGLCDQGRAGRVCDHMDMQAVECGERDGYGAWMDSLQRMWQQRDSVGCFTVGPCLGTVRHAIKRIDALLANPRVDLAGAELRAAIDRSGLDISLCRGCGKVVVCIPDGLSNMCEACACKETEASNQKITAPMPKENT